MTSRSHRRNISISTCSKNCSKDLSQRSSKTAGTKLFLTVLNIAGGLLAVICKLRYSAFWFFRGANPSDGCVLLLQVIIA